MQDSLAKTALAHLQGVAARLEVGGIVIPGSIREESAAHAFGDALDNDFSSTDSAARSVPNGSQKRALRGLGGEHSGIRVQ